MARPLRIEFTGAVYHVTSRGNARQSIFADDQDRSAFLNYLAQSCRRHLWLCHAYCLMSNHYHLLIETQAPTLSKGMKHLNGAYTQHHNRRHQRVGHIFQGRFKGILVEKDAHLLELARYIVLNPVRADRVQSPEQWPWSSYRATAGLTPAPDFLTTHWILSGLSSTRKNAIQTYRSFVSDGTAMASPWTHLKNQIYFGSEAFVKEMQSKLQPNQSLDDIPKPQTLAPAKALEWYESTYETRNLAMAHAYLSGHYTLTAVGKFFGVSYATVSRAVSAFEESQ